jgi:hypothetical protein
MASSFRERRRLSSSLDCRSRRHELICPSCQLAASARHQRQSDFTCAVGQITSTSFGRPALPKRGASRSSRTLVRAAMDATTHETNAARRGRRSRVVPMPRRWHQVGGESCKRRWQTSRSPGRARRKPLKPFARGKPDDPVEPVVDYLVCFFCARARGCGWASGFPCALY